MKKMRKLLAIAVAVVMFAGILPMAGAADVVGSGKCGVDLAWTLDADGLLTISGKGEMENYDDYYSLAPWHDKEVKSLSIGDGVTNIGDYAFYGCAALPSIAIPDGVTSIGVGAFEGCRALTSITIPDSVTRAGRNAFSVTPWYNAKPDGVVYTGKSLYKYKGNMPVGTSITVAPGTKEITECAFQNCQGLSSITIPDGVTRIGGYAFSGCPELSSITIPDSVTRIERYAFSGTAWYYTKPDGPVYVGKVFYRYKGDMPAGTSVAIDAGTKAIADGAFEYCDAALTSVSIPDGVTNIGSFAFVGCTSLTSITIPDSVTSIGDDAFSRCSALTSVAIPDGVPGIGLYAFYECTSLTSITIPDSVTSIGDSAFFRCSALSSVTIPDGVTSIGESAFTYCSALTSVTIPAGLTEIGKYAFDDCDDLQTIYYSGTEEQWGRISTGYDTENGRLNININLRDDMDRVIESRPHSVEIVFVSGASVTPGDVDLNGVVNAKDARLALRASASLETLDEKQFANADVDGDGQVIAKDARKILRVSASLDSF